MFRNVKVEDGRSWLWLLPRNGLRMGKNEGNDGDFDDRIEYGLRCGTRKESQVI